MLDLSIAKKQSKEFLQLFYMYFGGVKYVTGIHTWALVPRYSGPEYVVHQYSECFSLPLAYLMSLLSAPPCAGSHKTAVVFPTQQTGKIQVLLSVT